MGELDNRANQISETVTALNQGLHTTQQNNANSTRQIAGANDSVFMSLAKLDHVLWKVNTYLSIIDGKPSFDFVDHHQCRLGKWYETGDGHESFSRVNSFARLQKPHSLVHDATKQIFDLLKKSVPTGDASIQASIENMERGSDQVFQCLDQMLDEKTRQ